MTWECLDAIECECGHASWVTRSMNFAQIGHSLRPGLDPRRGHISPFEIWRKLVEDYSDRFLTKDEDKLIAISALAKLIQENFRNSEGKPYTYAAGLWKEEFVQDMSWMVLPSEHHGHKKKSTRQYRAPTWSWASLDQPVRFQSDKGFERVKYRPDLYTDCKIDEVISVPVLVSDATGLISSAYAQVTAPLIPVCKDSLRQEEVFEVFLDGPDEFPRSKNDSDPCGRQCCKLDGEDKLQLFDANTPYYLLRLFTFASFRSRAVVGPDGQMYRDSEIWFLVLKTSSLVEGAYERIGIGRRNNRAAGEPNERSCPLFQECETRSIKIV